MPQKSPVRSVSAGAGLCSQELCSAGRDAATARNRVPRRERVGKKHPDLFLPPSDLWSLPSQLKREPGWLSARLSLPGTEQGSEGWRIAGREADRE